MIDLLNLFDNDFRYGVIDGRLFRCVRQERISLRGSVRPFIRRLVCPIRLCKNRLSALFLTAVRSYTLNQLIEIDVLRASVATLSFHLSVRPSVKFGKFVFIYHPFLLAHNITSLIFRYHITSRLVLIVFVVDAWLQSSLVSISSFSSSLSWFSSSSSSFSFVLEALGDKVDL